MQDQPKYIPLRPSEFFADGRSERPLIEGTVARGHLNDDTAFYTGKGPDGKPLNTFPFPVTREVMRAARIATTCIARPATAGSGEGNGMIVRRGFRKPPSYHIDRLRQVPNGYIFDVITNGFGAMQDYAAQIQPARPLGHRGLHARAAIQPERHGKRRAARARAQLGPREVRNDGPILRTSTSRPPELQARSAPVAHAFFWLRRDRRGCCAPSAFLRSAVQFYRSYLWSYMFFVGVALGSMAWLMLQYLTGGAWGVVIRRPAEAAARTLPLLAADVRPDPDRHPQPVRVVARRQGRRDAILQHKHLYLNVPFFLVRAAVYFAGWIFSLVASTVVASSRIANGAACHRKMAALSRSGPHLLGLHRHIHGDRLGDVARPALVLHHFRPAVHRRPGPIGHGVPDHRDGAALNAAPMSEVLTPRHLHDLGKFLLAMVMVWAYFSFSQFLIIWAGNLPEEIPWYLERLQWRWQYVGLALVAGHFALPFALLLSRDLKRNFKLLRGHRGLHPVHASRGPLLAGGAGFRARARFDVSWMDFAAPIGLGGIWLSYFLTQLEKRPLMPLNDPQSGGGSGTWQRIAHYPIRSRSRSRARRRRCWAVGKFAIGLVVAVHRLAGPAVRRVPVFRSRCEAGNTHADVDRRRLPPSRSGDQSDPGSEGIRMPPKNNT